MEELKLPRFVLAERDALLAEIYDIFPGGSRVGGVSWSEAEALDRYGSPEECAAARASDRDARWQDVLEDPEWDPECGIGGWSFLDAIGFRYYLPPAMVVASRQGWDSGIVFHLTLREDTLRDRTQAKWTLFDLPQRLYIRRFVEYMAVAELYRSAGGAGRDWIEALTSYWGKVSDEESPSRTNEM